ncbi:MAG: hypothetical protein ABI809_03400 [Caldimonas sp.]
MLLALALPGAAPAHAIEIASAGFDAAREAYQQGRWEAAYAAFSALADRDDAEAARIALLMHRHGLPLYRVALAARAEQRLRWQIAASATGPRWLLDLQPPASKNGIGSMASALRDSAR